MAAAGAPSPLDGLFPRSLAPSRPLSPLPAPSCPLANPATAPLPGPTAAGGAAQEEAARAERYAEPVMAVADGEVSAAAWCLAHAESDSAPFGEVSVATLPLSAAAARPPR